MLSTQETLPQEVTISSDRRGWLIRPRVKGDLLRLGAALRSRLPGDHILAHREGYIVRPTGLPQLVELFPPGSGGWEDSGCRLAVAYAEVQERHARARLEVAASLEDPYGALADYSGLHKLDRHQVEAVAAMTVPSLVGIGLFDEQGVGKTITALAAFDVLSNRGEVEKMLVVAPKSVLAAWEGDSRLLFGDQKRVVTVWGSRQERRRILFQEHDIALISFESAVADKVYLRALLDREAGKYLLAVDESYYVKNPSAQRSAALAEIRQHCRRAFVLCGTPAPNSARDIVNQLNLADAGATFSRVVIPSTEQDAHEAIRAALEDSAIILRRLKEDVLMGLLPKEFERVYIDFQPRQGELYRAALESLVADVLTVDDAHFRQNLGSYMARRSALLQICSHPGSVVSNYTEQPAKLLAIDRLLEELIEGQGEKIVLWSFYRYTLERLDERYRRYGLVRIDGSVTSPVERAAAIESFQNDASVRIFLGNPAAAGAGITLTAGAHAVYESFSNQPAHYLQSVDRIHRRGQRRKVVSHVLITSGSLEEVEFDRLLEKEASARELLRDPIREPVTRHRFLRTLGVDPPSALTP